jgi:hypothetical protein
MKTTAVRIKEQTKHFPVAEKKISYIELCDCVSDLEPLL